MVENSTGKNRVKRTVIPWVTGLGVLPGEGGILDQSHRLMEFFSIFIMEDRIAASKKLSGKQIISESH